MTMKADMGLVGLAVMGENLVLNMESKGFSVAVFNRTVSKVDAFMAGRGKGKNIVGCQTVEELVENLEKPRKVMIMVKAGWPVDAFIEQILPFLSEGAVLVFDDILWSEGMKRAWNTIMSRESVKVSVELSKFGICVATSSSGEKQSFRKMVL